jgi:very-short-patch-repair endonuclease
MNKDIILYNSIYRYTEFMNNFNKNSNRLSSRIMFLIKHNNCDDIKCNICKIKYTSFNYKLNDFNKVCKSCFFKNNIHYPNKNFFILKYKDNWEFFYIKNRKKISEYKVNSQQWFINKYGETDGINNYNIYLKKRINILNNIKTNRYSKISQKLFWNIFNNLTSDEQKLCYFKELNNEKLLKVSENKYYFPDFLFKNKIIEYDGIYWHNNEKDNIRNTYYKNNGYDYLIINENDFNRNNFNLDVINKCIKFLRNEI